MDGYHGNMAFPSFQSLTVDEFRNQVLTVARDVFEKKPDGEELLPVLFVLHNSGESVIMPTLLFMQDDESKDSFVQFLRNLASNPDVLAFATVNEVWMSFVKENKEVVQPSLDPERTEAVMVKVDSRVSGSEVFIAKIENKDLGSFEPMPNVAGRMAGSSFGTGLPN
jgi:hypothetical protein